MPCCVNLNSTVVFEGYLRFSEVGLVCIGFRLTCFYSVHHCEQSLCLRHESHHDGLSEPYVWTSGKKHLLFHFITEIICSVKRHYKPRHTGL